MAYTPPSGDDVDFTFSSGYTPPSGDDVDFTFGFAGADIIIGIDTANAEEFIQTPIGNIESIFGVS